MVQPAAKARHPQAGPVVPVHEDQPFWFGDVLVASFLPHFVPGGILLRRDGEWCRGGRTRLRNLGIGDPPDSVLPDAIVHDPARRVVMLMDAYRADRPVDDRRRAELAGLFAAPACKPVVFAVFRDRQDLAAHLAELREGTAFWMASDPTHLVYCDQQIHGPHKHPDEGIGA